MHKNNSIIFDSSALICLISKEIGFEVVAEVISRAVMSSVSIAEVSRFLIERKHMSPSNSQKLVLSLIEHIVPFNAQLAFSSAEIIPQTKKFGISLGDRACLALAIEMGCPVYTADKIWAQLNLNCQVILIR